MKTMNIGEQVVITRPIYLHAECDPHAGHWCHGAQWRCASDTVGTIVAESRKRRVVRAAHAGAQWFGWIDTDDLKPLDSQTCNSTTEKTNPPHCAATL